MDEFPEDPRDMTPEQKAQIEKWTAPVTVTLSLRELNLLLQALNQSIDLEVESLKDEDEEAVMDGAHYLADVMILRNKIHTTVHAAADDHDHEEH